MYSKKPSSKQPKKTIIHRVPSKKNPAKNRLYISNLPQMVKQAVKDDPQRLVHGDTGKTGFVIVDGMVHGLSLF